MYANPTQRPISVISATTQPDYNIQHQNLVLLTATKKKSSELICFGIALLILSCIIFCFCMWIVSINSKFLINYVTVLCCLYHALLSVLAIIGGQNVQKNRWLIGICMCVAIVGVSVIASTTIIFNAISWKTSQNNCKDESKCVDFFTREPYSSTFCSFTCDLALGLHLPVILGVLIQIILDFMISIVNCTNICYCCGAPMQIIASGQIIQPQQNRQYSCNNPPYSFRQPAYNPASAIPLLNSQHHDINSYHSDEN